MLKAMLLAVLALSTPAFAQQMKGENLLLSVPDGYVAGFTDGDGKARIAEFVPKGQSVKNWREMLTLHIFFGGIDAAPTQYAKQFVARYSDNCGEGTGRIIRQGRERGYRFTFFAAICGLNPKTGKPEWVLAKAMEGHDSFYLIQKAWKYTPSEDEINKWSRYLGGVNLCDSRRKKAPCPVVSN
jgi:hypothetical protein